MGDERQLGDAGRARRVSNDDLEHGAVRPVRRLDIAHRHRPGDRLQPLGMTGHKKVSHLLVDAKRPRIDRDDVVVLARGKEIAWEGGICLGDGFKVRPDSQHLVYLELSTSFGGRNEMCDG